MQNKMTPCLKETHIGSKSIKTSKGVIDRISEIFTSGRQGIVEMHVGTPWGLIKTISRAGSYLNY